MIALVACVSAAFSAAPRIGIFPTITTHNYTGAYQEWVAEFGATSFIVPDKFDDPATLEKLFMSMNGFLIPGGGSDLSPSARAMVERAVKAHDAGDYFPVWGTCLGFEWLVDTFGGVGAIVAGFDAEALPLPLTFTPSMNESRVYKNASASLRHALETQAITYNAHTSGITPLSFASNAKLMATFSVLSTSIDRKGKAFVAQIEGKNGLPIYGNQFHPEKIEFVKDKPGEGDIPRTKTAIAAARELAAFFVSEAAKNKHVVTAL